MRGTLDAHGNTSIAESLGKMPNRAGVVEMDVRDDDPFEVFHSRLFQSGKSRLQRRGRPHFDQHIRWQHIDGSYAFEAMHEGVYGDHVAILVDHARIITFD